ncbi:TPA: hypothetical protein ACIAWF_004159 [Salmonella enterica subsp. enterica serovar Enteritidis]|nr:hypothetical protein [Salmonella enterica]
MTGEKLSAFGSYIDIENLNIDSHDLKARMYKSKNKPSNILNLMACLNIFDSFKARALFISSQQMAAMIVYRLFCADFSKGIENIKSREEVIELAVLDFTTIIYQIDLYICDNTEVDVVYLFTQEELIEEVLINTCFFFHEEAKIQ